MEPAGVLTKFLLENSSFDKIIPLDAFCALFPVAIPRESILKLYHLLSSQHEVKLESVAEEITHEFDPPIESYLESINVPEKLDLHESLDDFGSLNYPASFSCTIKRLHDFRDTLFAMERDADSSIKSLLDEIALAERDLPSLPDRIGNEDLLLELILSADLCTDTILS